MNFLKKTTCFILTILFFVNYFNFNIYADQQYISVGLSKYKNVNNISLDNKELTIGKNNDSSFYSEATLSTNKSFNIKTLNLYSIKYNNRFYSYEDALNFSKNYKDAYLFKDDSWYVMIGNFTNMLDANTFITNENINGEIYKIDNSIGIYEDTQLLIAFKESVAIKSNENISISGKEYRNTLSIICKNNLLIVINILDIEEYLYGVVPSEMPSSWHKEALKAQAVASRNYAYSNLGIHSSEGYDVCDTVHCQVYNGVSNEKQSTNEAINETKGIFAYYNNEKINAVYSSSSGGYTDDAENVWNYSIPYLKAVKDEYEEGAKQWTRTFTFDELSNVASIGTVNQVILESSSVTGRAISLTLIGSSGEKVLEKEEIRTFFSKFSDGSLDSRNFKMAKGNTYTTNNTNTQTNADSIYVISSNGNNTININSVFVADKNTNTTKIKNTFAIDKNQSILNFLNLTSTTTSNLNYTSKVTRDDSNSITFIGKGWGHGVGMSQYGANSLAKKGYTYDEILKYYYTGIEVR